jgi:transcription initiation factor TFIID subunit 11
MTSNTSFLVGSVGCFTSRQQSPTIQIFPQNHHRPPGLRSSDPANTHSNNLSIYTTRDPAHTTSTIMASPPPSALSPPGPSSLALPRQRTGPSLTLPNGAPAPKPRRKPSTASATSSSHPLRQTSFPPPEGYGSNHNAMYSPEGSADFSDSEITSAISGMTGNAGGDGNGAGKKRKRGEKRARGRPPKNAAAGGDDARSTTGTLKGAASTTGKAAEEAEEEEEEDEEDAAGGRGLIDENAVLMEETDKRGKEFLVHMPEWQLERHGTWKRSKLKQPTVKTLVNQTLSQSVPQNVILVVQAYTKMFAGLIIEGARDVQAEWAAVAEKRPDGEDNHVLKTLRGEGSEVAAKDRIEKEKKNKEEAKQGETNGDNPEAMDVDADADVPVKKEDDDSPTVNGLSNSEDTQTEAGDSSTQPNGHQNGDEEKAPPVLEASMGVRRQIEEVDLGPLLPDHLREALRRYKKAQYGGTVGFTGLSLEGKNNAAARMGGRKLFK